MINKQNIAVAYYTALGEKNLKDVEKCLHPDIHFINPQGEMKGKEAVLKAAQGFTSIFTMLTIVGKFESETQAVIIYEIEVPHLSKSLRAVSLMNFQEGLISRMELIFDPRALMEKK